MLGSANQQTLPTSQTRRRLSSPVKNLINIFITPKRFCLSRQPHRVTRRKHPRYSSVLSSLPLPPTSPSPPLADPQHTSNQRPLSFPGRRARIPAFWLQVFSGTDAAVRPQRYTVDTLVLHPHPARHPLHHLPGQSHNLPEPPCDEPQTSSVSRGQLFTRVSNLITAENREKTSKCN